MPWLLLILSGLLETVWAIALSQSAGFTRVVPSVIFVIALAASMVGLGYAVRTIPIGTGYAVWVGIGVALQDRRGGAGARPEEGAAGNLGR
jgi:quaternary ammonium compound-resistance protein SugE